MTKILKWRLGKLPTPSEVQMLVNDKLITKEEARDILFNEVDEKEESLEDLKSEVKFLRELIEKLANRSQIVETIKYVGKPYVHWGWYNPYQVWCGAGDTNTAYIGGGNGTMYLTANSDSSINIATIPFSQIN